MMPFICAGFHGSLNELYFLNIVFEFVVCMNITHWNTYAFLPRFTKCYWSIGFGDRDRSRKNLFCHHFPPPSLVSKLHFACWYLCLVVLCDNLSRRSCKFLSMFVLGELTNLVSAYATLRTILSQLSKQQYNLSSSYLSFVFSVTLLGLGNWSSVLTEYCSFTGRSYRWNIRHHCCSTWVHAGHVRLVSYGWNWIACG